MKKSLIVVLILALLVILPSFVSALGLSPAKMEFNFVPNEEHTINYRVYHDDPNKQVEVYAQEDLTQYVHFDRSETTPLEGFKVTLKFPGDISPPGMHKILIAAKEKASQQQFIGTSVTVRAVIYVFVPYPGKYIESSLNIPNANMGESVPIELSVINRGTENLDVGPVISFYDSSGKFVSKMDFDSLAINRGEMNYFRGYLNTEGLKPDNYFADVIIGYSGQTERINSTFRLGNLRINITDFTRNLTANEINKFNIKIKSNWNGRIDEVYSDVKIWLNDSDKAVFRTPSVDLAPFEEKELTGYFEANGLKEGRYKMDIILNYAGQTTYGPGEVVVIKKGISTAWILAGVSIAFLIILIIIGAYLILRKNKKKR